MEYASVAVQTDDSLLVDYIKNLLLSDSTGMISSEIIGDQSENNIIGNILYVYGWRRTKNPPTIRECEYGCGAKGIGRFIRRHKKKCELRPAGVEASDDEDSNGEDLKEESENLFAPLSGENKIITVEKNERKENGQNEISSSSEEENQEEKTDDVKKKKTRKRKRKRNNKEVREPSPLPSNSSKQEQIDPLPLLPSLSLAPRSPPLLPRTSTNGGEDEEGKKKRRPRKNRRRRRKDKQEALAAGEDVSASEEEEEEEIQESLPIEYGNARGEIGEVGEDDEGEEREGLGEIGEEELTPVNDPFSTGQEFATIGRTQSAAPYIHRSQLANVTTTKGIGVKERSPRKEKRIYDAIHWSRDCEQTGDCIVKCEHREQNHQCELVTSAAVSPASPCILWEQHQRTTGKINFSLSIHNHVSVADKMGFVFGEPFPNSVDFDENIPSLFLSQSGNILMRINGEVRPVSADRVAPIGNCCLEFSLDLELRTLVIVNIPLHQNLHTREMNHHLPSHLPSVTSTSLRLPEELFAGEERREGRDMSKITAYFCAVIATPNCHLLLTETPPQYSLVRTNTVPSQPIHAARVSEKRENIANNAQSYIPMSLSANDRTETKNSQQTAFHYVRSPTRFVSSSPPPIYLSNPSHLPPLPHVSLTPSSVALPPGLQLDSLSAISSLCERSPFLAPQPSPYHYPLSVSANDSGIVYSSPIANNANTYPANAYIANAANSYYHSANSGNFWWDPHASNGFSPSQDIYQPAIETPSLLNTLYRTETKKYDR